MIFAIENMATRLQGPCVVHVQTYGQDLERAQQAWLRLAPFTQRSPQQGKITTAPQAQRYAENTLGIYEKNVIAGPVIFAELARLVVPTREFLILRYVDRWFSGFDANDGPFQGAGDDITWHLRINLDPTVSPWVGAYNPGRPHGDCPQITGYWSTDRQLGILVPAACTVQLIAELATAVPKNKQVAGRLVGYRMSESCDEALRATRAAI